MSLGRGHVFMQVDKRRPTPCPWALHWQEHPPCWPQPKPHVCSPVRHTTSLFRRAWACPLVGLRTYLDLVCLQVPVHKEVVADVLHLVNGLIRGYRVQLQDLQRGRAAAQWQRA